MGKKPLPDEFKDFILLLNKHKVKYLLLGGWAVSYYSNPRPTKDIDFFVLVDKPNLSRLKQVFLDFQAPPVDLAILTQPRGYIHFGSHPLQIEVISHADGINFKDCFSRRNIVDIDGVQVNIISKSDLIINKSATTRPYDIADAEVLKSFLYDPLIKTKDVLRSKIILANLRGAYKTQLDNEKRSLKISKKLKLSQRDLSVIKYTINLYNKAFKSKNQVDLFALHKAFKYNPLDNKVFSSFPYKSFRKKIYDEIEYRLKLLLKNEYSYLITTNSQVSSFSKK